MKINMPRDVRLIIEKLIEAGYEAYAVGGCVRDSLIGREPHDWDITTSATPYEIKDIFKKTIDTGLKHGTVTVMMNHVGYEVTTFRIDGEYSDHRRPDSVTFTRELREDLLRRDFTINAMAYNDKTGVVDLYGGMDDLRDKVIRCVGNPDERFDEDALRIFRAVRFSAQLGYSIEAATADAIKRHVEELRMVSAERIETEFTKLITSDHPEKIEELYDYGITSVFLPEFDVLMRTEQETPYHIYDVGHHTIEVMKNVSPRKHMRYAALLHDIGKPAAKTTEVLDREVHGKYYHNVDHFKGHNVIGADMVPDIMKRLRMDNDTMKAVSRLVYFHDVGINGFSKKGMRRLLSKLGTENFEDLYELRIADMKGQSDFKLEERKQLIREFREYYEEIVKDRDALSIKDLMIDGTGLMNMGVPKGPEVGKILNALLEKVLENPSLNEKEELERLALEMINSGKREVYDVTI